MSALNLVLLALPLAIQDDSVAAPASHGTEVARTQHFVFHASPLMNLHHLLYQCAKDEAHREGKTVPGRPIAFDTLPALEALEGDEARAWKAAVAWYVRDAIERDLLFDGVLYRLKGQLASVAEHDGALPADVDPSYARALETAFPVYFAHVWPDHEREIRTWVDAAMDRLARFGPALAERTSRAYGGTWPREPIRVDVCAYANWAGAYTTGNPDHIVLAVAGAGAAGDGLLETLFHEAAHTPELIGSLRDELAAAFEAAGAELPPDLWHLLIFMAAGDATRRELADAGVYGYIPYGTRTGVYERGSWARLKPRVDDHWQAWLDGQVERREALGAMAEALKR